MLRLMCMGDAALRPSPPRASPAGILPKPHGWHQFVCPCALFSPARVDNVLAQALARAWSQPPRSARATARGGPRQRCQPLRNTMAGGRGSRPRCFPGTPGCAVVSGPACTALRRQGRAVARAGGPTPPSSTAPPCGTLPRQCLRAVQAMQSSCTSGQTCVPVCPAVGGPVSAGTLKRTLRGWTAPAWHWAARRCSGPPSARQRARTAAAPRLTSLPP